MNVTTATPAQIDTEIARINGEMAAARQIEADALATLDRIDGLDDEDRDLPWNSPAKREEAATAARGAAAKIKRLMSEVEPLNAEYVRRGGWTRFYLVTNTGGHIHHTTACDTCFSTTQFAWLTDYSGMEHAALVGEAGEVACTRCFPDAPVDVLRRASRIKYEAPEAKARREEREAKRAAAAEAEVVVEGFIGYGGRIETKTFKTARAVTNMIADRLGALCWYGTEHPSAGEWGSNIKAAQKALIAKGVEYDYDKALAAARKKVTREGCQPKF